MKTTVKLITPGYAKQLLEKNTINRRPCLPVINDYARQMAAGLWNEETGESIKIASNGLLLDGQQRLMALIKANVELKFLVVDELDIDVFSVIDSGKKRSSGDVFYTSGITNANNIAAGLRKYTSLKSRLTISNSSGNYRGITSSSELLTLYSKRPNFFQMAGQMSALWYTKSGRIMPPSEYIGYYTFFYDIDPDDSYTFMSKLGEGIDLSYDSPIRLLRDKLLGAKINTRYSMSGFTKTALVIKSWNYFRNGETPKILKFAPELESML